MLYPFSDENLVVKKMGLFAVCGSLGILSLASHFFQDDFCSIGWYRNVLLQ